MSDPEEMHIAFLDGPVALRLADLGSIHQDLGFVMGCCERLRPMLEDDADSDPVLVEALWSAAAIAYARCFASGKRLGLDESILAALPGEPEAFHRFVRDLRDKHIAHSVNPFEQVRVGAVLSSISQPSRTVEGISTVSLRHIATTLDGVNGLWLLARALRAKVGELASATTEEVLDIARTIPIEELYARPQIGVTAPGPADAGTARS